MPPYPLRTPMTPNHECNVGRGGALVETMTFNRRVVGWTPALAPHVHVGTLGKSFTCGCLCASA